MQVPVEALILVLDRVLAGAVELATLIARLRAGDQVTDAQARPRPRAEVEAEVRAIRETMIRGAGGQT